MTDTTQGQDATSTAAPTDSLAAAAPAAASAGPAADHPDVDELFPKQDVDELFPANYKPPEAGGSSPLHDFVFSNPLHKPARVLDAFGYGFKQAWGSVAPEFSEANEALRKYGVYNDYAKGQHSIIKAANETLMRPAVAALVAAHGVWAGMFSGTQQALQKTGEELGSESLGRTLASIPEAFPTGVHQPMGIPRLPEPPLLKPAAVAAARVERVLDADVARQNQGLVPHVMEKIQEARELGVIGSGEDGYFGTKPLVDSLFPGKTPQEQAAAKALAEAPKVTEKDWNETILGQKPGEAPSPIVQAAPQAGEANPAHVQDLTTATGEPQPTPSVGATQPAVVQSIVDDVKRQLMAAGRPEAEAEVSGQLVAFHYRARAERFQGALGTPEELYARDGASIRRGAGVQPVQPAEAAQQQLGLAEIKEEAAAPPPKVIADAAPADRASLEKLIKDGASSDEIANHPIVKAAQDENRARPQTKDLPGYGTDEFKANREFNFDGEKVKGYDAAIERLTHGAKVFSSKGPVKAEREATIILGPPASGKSRLSETYARERNAAIVDSDEAKKVIPEYDNGAGTSAVHEESSDLMFGENGVLERLVDEGANLVLPKVGHSPGSIRQIIQGLKQEGYRVNLVNMNVEPAEAYRRMIGRFLKTGRVIGSDYFGAVGDKPTKTYYTLKGEGGLHEAADIDVNGPIGAERFIDGEGTSLERNLRSGRDRKPEDHPDVAAPAGPEAEAAVGHAEPVQAAMLAADHVDSLSPAEQKRDLPAYSPAAEQTPKGIDQPAGVFMFNPTALNVDAKRFQFKSGGDEYGETGALRNVTKWDPAKAQAIIVWEQNDGQLYVADGHQRAGLARRLTEQGKAKNIQLPGILYREKDGVSADDIRAVAAVTNIANGSGSALDGAKVLRARPDLMDGSLPLSVGKGKQAAALARLGDEPFRMVVNDVVPEHYGAVVGELIPHDPVRQEAALKAIARFEPKNADEAAVLTQRVAQAELQKQESGRQTSMFGDLETPESTAGEEMKIVGRAIADLKKDKSLFARVIANAERIEQTGSSIAREAAQGVMSDAEIFAKTLTSEAYSAGPLRTELIAAAKDLKSGKIGIGDATSRIFAAVRRQAEAHGADRAGAVAVQPETEREFAQLDRGGPRVVSSKAIQQAVLKNEWLRHGRDLDFEDVWETATGQRAWKKAADAWNERHGTNFDYDEIYNQEGFRDSFDNAYLKGKKAPFPGVQAANDFFENNGDHDKMAIVESDSEYQQSDRDLFEPGAEGKPQTLIPGVKPVTQRDLIQAAANKPMGPKGKKPQKPVGSLGGLFGDSMDQKELFQQIFPDKAEARIELNRSTRAIEKYHAKQRAYDDGAGPPLTHEERVDYLDAFRRKQAAQQYLTSQQTINDELAQTAWHGSPYHFDIFDTGRIGSGEGAQSYGHGLYFAEHPDVGREYQRALTVDRESHASAQHYLEQAGGDQELAIELMKQARGADLRRTIDVNERSIARLKAQALTTREERKEAADRIAHWEKQNAAARRELPDPQADPETVAALKAPKGVLYRVDIKPEPHEFLQWDKPLSEQPQAIRDALEKATPKPGWLARQWEGEDAIRHEIATSPESTGAQAYGALAKILGSQKAATDALREAGLPGIRYLDQFSRTEGQGTHNYVVFDPKHIQILDRNGEPVSQRQFEFNQIKRGSIRLREDAKPVIKLFADANASTFIHETGHQWLEELMDDARHEHAPADLKADAETVLKWLEVDKPEDIKRRHHEQFARGFETYMMEGRAPTPELASVFARFKDWLTRIYRTVMRLNSPISDEVRGVFDRLIVHNPEPHVAEPPTFADLHEADAASVPHEAAREAANTIASERDLVANRTMIPEEHDARLEGVAGRDKRHPAGGAQPDDHGNAAGAESGEKSAPVANGTVSPSGTAAAPQGAGARESAGGEQPVNATEPFRLSETPWTDKAGNIRLENINAPDDVKQVLRDAANRNNGFIAERRGVITDAEALALSQALGEDPSFLDRKAIGTAYTKEEIFALEHLLIQSATAVRDAMAKGDEVAYAEVKARHMMIHDIVQAKASAARAEAGRALQAFAAMKRMPGAKDAAALQDWLKVNTGKTLFQLQEEMKFGSKLSTPAQVSQFLNDSFKKNFHDAVVYYYVNALISGPVTHFRYSIGNAINAIWKPLVELPTAALISAAKEAAGVQSASRVYMGEAGAQLFAITKGSRDGLTAAIKAFQDGVSPPLKGENVSAHFAEMNASYRQPIPGPAGTVIGIPGRSVAAIHSFFKQLRYEQEIQGQAYRQATREGLQGEAFNNRIGQLTTQPTTEMMDAATRESLKELFMAPTDYHSFMGMLTRATNSNLIAKIMVPFMKIGSQITRNAFIERTPLGLASRDVRATLADGGAGADIQAAKMATGVALMGATVLLAAEGMATGDGPTDPAARSVWLLNHRPNSVVIGGVSMPYQGLGHLGMLMRFSANMYETAHYWDGEDGGKLATSFFEGLTKSVMDENFMRGVKDMLDAVYHPEEYGASYIRNNLTNWIPFSVGLGQVAREIDPYQREAHSIFDAARAKIPLVSEGLFPRRDRFGEPIPNGPGLPQYQNDPVVQAMERLNLGIAPVPKKIRNVELTAQQYDDFSRIAGRMVKMQLNAFINTSGINQLPDELQRQKIHEIVEHAREAARGIVMMQNPQILEHAREKKIAPLLKASPLK